MINVHAVIMLDVYNVGKERLEHITHRFEQLEIRSAGCQNA